MDLKDIYRNRFVNKEERVKMWKILVEDFFQKYIGKGDVVLDIPCGYCEFINNVKCKKKIAIDLNGDGKKYTGSGVSFYKSSSTKLPLKDKSVDKIFVSNFFEHLNRGDIQKTIGEFRRVLRNGGQVLVLQPNIRFCQKDYWMFFDHITPIDDRALDEVFNANGFNLKQKVLRFLPYTTKGKMPVNQTLIKLYLKLPFFWKVFGKQSFMIFERR